MANIFAWLLPELKEEYLAKEKYLIRKAIFDSEGFNTDAAKTLRISRTKLVYLIKKLGLRAELEELRHNRRENRARTMNLRRALALKRRQKLHSPQKLAADLKVLQELRAKIKAERRQLKWERKDKWLLEKVERESKRLAAKKG